VVLDIVAEGSPARILVDAFVSARLLVAGGESGAASTVRLAHEALIGRWQRARDQLDADRRDLETRTMVEREFVRWEQARGRVRWLLLLRNPDLANAIDLAKRWGDEFDVAMREFISKSSRRARVAQTLTAAAAVLFALVARAAFYAERFAEQQQVIAIEQRGEAEKQTREAQLQRGRAVSMLAREATERGDATTGMLAALSVMPPDSKGLGARPHIAVTAMALLDAWLRNREVPQ
jgi:hypothetical protein